MTLTITLPLPSPKLSPNARVHYMEKAKLTKALRARACLDSTAFMAAESARYSTIRKPRYDRAKTSIQWFTRTITHGDPDNCLSQIKGALDGITDSGFLSDDRGLAHEPIQFKKDAANPRVVITVTPY